MFPQGFQIEAKQWAEELFESGMTLLSFAEKLGISMPEKSKRERNMEILAEPIVRAKKEGIFARLCGKFGK